MNLKPHCLALALACAGLAGPLPALADAIAASGARLVVVDTEAADPVAGLESDMKAIVEGLLAGKG